MKTTQLKINKLIIYPEEVLLRPSIPDAECLATMLVQQDSIPLIVHEKGKVKVSEQLSGSEQRGMWTLFYQRVDPKWHAATVTAGLQLMWLSWHKLQISTGF